MGRLPRSLRRRIKPMITSHADMEELFEPDYNTENISLKDEGNKRRKIATDFIEDSFKNRENVSLDTLSILDREDGYSVIAWRLLNTTTNKIPSEYYPDCVYTPDLLKHLISNGKLICKKVYSNKNYGDSEIYYMFRYKGTIVNFMFGFSEDNPQGLIMNLGIIYNAGDDIYIEDYEPFIKKPKETAKIGIIKTTKYGPAVSWMEHKTDYTFSEDNYNDDFSTFYSDLKDKLKTNKTGLYLFYGEAGTGKSSAIRQLITDTDRKVVFLPPQMINCLASPDFTDLVLNSLKGSILVIEDAEKALMKRESEDGFHNSELVSTILNLTDGLYSDLAHISIIATYNCDRNLIDPALLRKGRLRSEYHFKKLSVDKSQKLVDSLNHDFDVDSPMTLAEIFNYEKQFSNRESEKKRSVGFGA